MSKGNRRACVYCASEKKVAKRHLDDFHVYYVCAECDDKFFKEIIEAGRQAEEVLP